MRDWSRPAVLVALVLLFVVLLARGPVVNMELGEFIRPLLLVGLGYFLFSRLGGGRCCGTRRADPVDPA